MSQPTREALRQYCIRNKLFTCGTNEQYKKMFDAVGEQLPLHDIATIIWLCSETDKHASEIEKELQALGAESEVADEDNT